MHLFYKRLDRSAAGKSDRLLETLPTRLLIAAATTGPRPERWIRAAVASC